MIGVLRHVLYCWQYRLTLCGHGQQQCSGRRWCFTQLVLKGLKVWQETKTPSPSNCWYKVERINAFIFSFIFFLYVSNSHRTIMQEKPVFQSSIAHFQWDSENGSLRFLLLANRMAPSVVFCCCGPSASRFHMSSIQRCSSAHCGYNALLFEWTSYQLDAVWPLFVDHWH